VNIFLRSYEYFYYKLYIWHIYLHKGKCHPETSARVALSFFMGVNIINVLVILNYVTGYQVLQLINNLPKITLIIFILSLDQANSFYLNYKGRYKGIVNKLNKEDKKDRIIGNVIVWFFMMFTIFLGFICIYFLKNHGPLFNLASVIKSHCPDFSKQ